MNKEESEMKDVERESDQEILTIGQRCGELMSIAAMLLLFGFFVSHQRAHTGFFTAKFGMVEMVCLYGPMLVSLAALGVRAVSGRRNPGRLLDVATNVFLTIAAVFLLMTFPFDFSHLADALPTPIHFLLAWITNDIGKVILILQIIVGPVSAFFTIRNYLAFRWRKLANSYEQ